MTDRVALVTADDETLEAELAPAAAPRAQVVLCHPHPQFGGDMRSLVISELFRALPDLGITTLRFNFRGVGHSTGAYDGGDAERHDVRAAVAWLHDHDASRPLFLVGWSFGADLALSDTEPALAGWVAIALPMRFGHDLGVVGADPRPKLVLLAANDEYRDASEVEAVAAGWRATTTEVIAGASHFFVGRTARLVEATSTWITDQV